MRNPVYEQALNRAGVQWVYVEEIKLEDINLQRGLRNQARILSPLDDDLVERYRERAMAGDEFPPVVLWKPGPRVMYVPVDGNNRLAAYGKVHKKKSTDAYVLSTEDEKVVDFLTWTFNNEVNGKRLSAEEDLEHAITLVRKHGYTSEDVSKACRVKMWLLRQKIRALEVKETLQAHGQHKSYAEVTDTKLDKLHALSTAGEEVLMKAVEVVGKTAAGETETQELVKEVRAAKTVPAKMEVLENYGSRPEVKARQAETRNGSIKRPRPAPRDELQRLLRQIHQLLDCHVDEALTPVGTSDKRQCQLLANTIIKRLKQVYKVHANEEDVP